MVEFERMLDYSHAWVIQTQVIQKPALSDHQFSSTDYISMYMNM